MLGITRREQGLLICTSILSLPACTGPIPDGDTVSPPDKQHEEVLIRFTSTSCVVVLLEKCICLLVQRPPSSESILLEGRSLGCS